MTGYTLSRTVARPYAETVEVVRRGRREGAPARRAHGPVTDIGGGARCSAQAPGGASA